jgi:transporter family protein
MSFVFNIKIMKIMQNWFILALISMFFAGLTSVIAKFGMTGISADLGLSNRTK